MYFARAAARRGTPPTTRAAKRQPQRPTRRTRTHPRTYGASPRATTPGGLRAPELEATIQAVARLGLRNQVTELDISLRDHVDAPVPPITNPLLGVQVERWRALFKMFRRNAGRIDAVVLWGVNDESSWLGPPDQPLLFTGFLPKPAFWVVLDQVLLPTAGGGQTRR